MRKDVKIEVKNDGEQDNLEESKDEDVPAV